MATVRPAGSQQPTCAKPSYRVGEDGTLLEGDERGRSDAALVALEQAIAGTDRHAIEAQTTFLNEATTPFAHRRMTRKIGAALENKRIDDVA